MRTRRKAKTGHRIRSGAAADVPRCCTCKRPLPRLPASQGLARARVFQCAECFYPGTGRSPRQATRVASDRDRWLDQCLGGD